VLTWQSRVLEVFVLETMCNFAKPCPTSVVCLEGSSGAISWRLNPNSVEAVTFVGYLCLISRRISSPLAGSIPYMNMSFGWYWRLWFLWLGFLTSSRTNSPCASDINFLMSTASLSRMEMISAEMILKPIDVMGVGPFLVYLKGLDTSIGDLE